MHLDKIFFTHHRLDDISQVFRDWIAITFAHNLTRILNREFDLQILVPVGIDLQFSLPDPLGIILVDVLDFKIVLDVEFFQSGPD